MQLCLQLRDVHRISVLADQGCEIVRAQPHGGRVVVRVHADESRRGEKRFIEIELRLALCIVEQAERRHGAGDEPEHLHEVIFGRKRQRARAEKSACRSCGAAVGKQGFPGSAAARVCCLVIRGFVPAICSVLLKMLRFVASL